MGSNWNTYVFGSLDGPLILAAFGRTRQRRLDIDELFRRLNLRQIRLALLPFTYHHERCPIERRAVLLTGDHRELRLPHCT